jgi:hypothetical protein
MQMTTTQTRPRPQVESLDPKEVIRDIGTSTTFGEVMRGPNARLATAFAMAALELADLEVSPEGERTLDGYAYLLAGQLNDVVGSIVALERATLNKEARIPHKDKLSGFNHDIRHMIDEYPDITPAEIQRLLVQAYIAAHRSEWSTDKEARAQVDLISGAIGSSLYGMWSEVAGELVVAEAGFEIDTDVTPEEERKGIDGWVLMRPELGDKGWMPCDFKGDELKAERVNAAHSDNYALWSQFSHQEYSPTKSFRIPRERLAPKVPSMKRALEDLYRWYTR